MKDQFYKFILLCVFFGTGSELYGQLTWVSQTSPTTNAFYSSHFINSTTGWASASNGTIVKTTNGGLNWSLQSTGSAESLFSVSFSDVNNGWTVGSGGVILSTNNGGASWVAQTSGVTNNLNDVFFTSGTHGWAVGNTGIILSTTNGGVSWSAQNSGVTNNLFSVHFVSETEGWAVGNTGLILNTTNGGLTWTNQVSGTGQNLLALDFISASQGWACGSGGVILTTNNGGINWSAQNSGQTTFLRAIDFISPNEGWITGNNGLILTSSNGGNIWSTQVSGTTDQLRALSMVSSTKGWTSGGNGLIKSFQCTTPAPIGNSTQYFCSTSNPTVSSLSAAGNGILWYSGATGGAPLSASAPLNNGLYYASQTDQGCESESRFAVNVILQSAPPGFPGIISGNSLLCVGTDEVLTVNPISNANFYVWNIPGILSGTSSTNSITITALSVGSSMVTMSAQNACGSSGNQSKGMSVVDVPMQPDFIYGDADVCTGTLQTYTIDPVLSAVSYLWSKPLDWSGLSNTPSFATGIGQNSGMITVVAINSCGTSLPQEMAITVLTVPSNPGIISGNSFLCSGSEETYSVSPVNGADNYTWAMPNDWTGSSISSSIIVTAGELSGVLTLTALNECGSSSSVKGVNVTITPQAPTGNDMQTFCNTATVSQLSASGNSIQWYSTINGTLPMNPSESLIGGNSYFATQSESGCESINRLEVVADIQIPTMPTGTAIQSFCNSASIMDLSVSGNNIQWYSTFNGTTPLNLTDPLIDGNTYFASQTENNCESAGRLEVQANINPLPDVSINNLGSTLEAMLSGANSYQWLDCNNVYAIINGETDQTFDLTQNGSYAVEINLNGCVDTSACEVVSNVSLSEQQASSILLYPNPTNSEFTIESSNGITSVEIFSLSGQIIDVKAFEGQEKIKMELDAAPGIYLVKIKEMNGSTMNVIRLTKE